jgi:hypothetical protein
MNSRSSKCEGCGKVSVVGFKHFSSKGRQIKFVGGENICETCLITEELEWEHQSEGDRAVLHSERFVVRGVTCPICIVEKNRVLLAGVA